MQENQAGKDTKKLLARTGITASGLSETAFDLTDKSAKGLSKHLHPEGTKSHIRTTGNEGEQIGTGNDPKTGERTSLRSKGTAATQIRTLVLHENGHSETPTVEGADHPDGEKSERISSLFDVAVSVTGSKIKTGARTEANKSAAFLNRHTFDFQPSQGNVSKTVTAASKTGKAASKISKKAARKARTVSKEMDDKSGGMETATYKANQAAKKLGSKIAQKSVSFLVKAIMTTVKMAIRAILSALAAILPSFAPVVVVLVGVAAIFGMIFGFGASTDNVLPQYEAYMIEVQERYDAEVDAWMRENPGGIVVGVKGDYGMIDWRMPLAIIQATQTELSFDDAERDLLEAFDAAGLFEQHIVVEYDTVEENDSGIMERVTIPVMTIINPGYEDYMAWCSENFASISHYISTKNVSHPQTSFTSDEIEIIDSLYASDNFFDEFSDEFKLHTTMKGENTSEDNFNSAEYNHLNIFTQAGYKGQCTWYAYGRALKLTGKKMPSGDAQTWLTSAIAMGYPTGTRPSVNSVVVMTGGEFGHVAYVEAWDGKSIRVSEGNINNPMNGTDQMVEYAREHAVELVYEAEYDSYEEFCAVHESWGLTVVGFIYLE